jgi:hypothetical protein
MMLDEHRTPRRFWADAISTVWYISNQIFLRSILNLTPFELCFGCKSSVSHLRPFGCKCFVLKHDNLNKFESHSSDGILLGYTPHGRSYRVFNLETNTVVASCDVTFDETAPCPHDVFECAADKEMDEHEPLAYLLMRNYRASTVMNMNHYIPLRHHPSLFLLPHLKQRLLRILPLPQQQLRHHGLRGRSSPSKVLPLMYRRHIHINKS